MVKSKEEDFYPVFSENPKEEKFYWTALIVLWLIVIIMLAYLCFKTRINA
jgi:hypothetical protein